MLLPSEFLWPQQDCNQIEEEADRGDRREPEVEGHLRSPSRIVAQADIGERQRQQSDYDQNPEKILHDMFQSEGDVERVNRRGDVGP
ncbi:hypothetical protein GCM10009087_56150 [Sphingomonas oligophenolica]